MRSATIRGGLASTHSLESGKREELLLHSTSRWVACFSPLAYESHYPSEIQKVWNWTSDAIKAEVWQYNRASWGAERQGGAHSLHILQSV